ncbi:MULTISPECIES: hypothetical protein [Dactylosporangium]|uniref:PIN domain-containing protein n=2 Tax=Dactylosporangium TaxID=35753 RepID=A0A9W6KVI2_9ACTN|nr:MULTISPECIES: hypothetical protein [Dactylosporangium]UAB92133.1 hypothetical protein Dvina_27490 [Dactylosporangium vinaceum]UWZ48994.1 hypothetical protein Dmats_22925 [Dactylosporangium matsuzakiense]GLL08438.1 hypothetical protein GCM10017581_102000 [Dactylosporangium matsuzakiense]
MTAVGGRILDSSAILGFVAGKPYSSAIVWHAVDQGVVLAVPAAALAEAWAQTSPKDYDVLKVLLSLPVVVVDELTAADAVDSGALFSGEGGPATVAAAHVVRRAQARPGWAIVTDRAQLLRELDPQAEIDELP